MREESSSIFDTHVISISRGRREPQRGAQLCITCARTLLRCSGPDMSNSQLGKPLPALSLSHTHSSHQVQTRMRPTLTASSIVISDMASLAALHWASSTSSFFFISIESILIFSAWAICSTKGGNPACHKTRTVAAG